MLDLNVTFVIQLINLLITLVLINYLLVRPVRDVIARRKAGSDNISRQIDDFVSRAARDAAQYESSLRAARDEGGAIRRQAREDALATQQNMLAAAAAKAADLARLERERACGDSDRAKSALAAQVDSLAADVARKLLA